MNITNGLQIGRKAVFAEEQQRELSDHLFYLLRLFYEVRRPANEFAEA